MHMAVEWAVSHLGENSEVTVFTDSQSLCMALEGSCRQLDQLRKMINTAKPTITIQWVPGHCGVPGNEMADGAAKEAASMPGCSKPVTFSSVCSRIRAICKDPPICHDRTREVYSSLCADREKNIKTRSDQSLLAKLRTGHYTGLRAYRSRIDNGATDPTCNRCDMGAPQDLDHWISCPAIAPLRRNLIGDNYEQLYLLTKYPAEAVALARSTLLGARP